MTRHVQRRRRRGWSYSPPASSHLTWPEDCIRCYGGRPVAFSWYGADLHVHTGLSPCASDDMSPVRIVRRAAEAGVSILGITDHNSAENVAAVVAAAAGSGVHVLPGMEAQTREEVHVICLFDQVDQAMGLQEYVYCTLPDFPYSPGAFGRQILYGADDSVRGECRKPLYAAAGLSLSEFSEEVRKRGGLIIAAHVDRPAFSVLGTLGFIPPDVPFDALEVRNRGAIGQVPGYRHVWSSDAHRVDDVGLAMTAFYLREVNVEELRMAF
ncbi:MAG: PHP domain-containing protein [Bacillota bacterium]